jgi:type IV secretion system protein VirB4
MVANALLNELTYGRVASRELPVARHVPYLRHVQDEVIKLADGVLMTVLKLDGFSFETADQSELNVRLLARNDVLRTLGNSRFALTSHIIRREVFPSIASSFDNAFCRELDERYMASLGSKRMFVNDIYLTLLRRNMQGHVGTFDVMMKRLMGKRDAAGESVDEKTALTELLEAAAALKQSLGPYGARTLGVVKRDGIWMSEPLEFLVQLLNGALPRPMPLPRMPLNEALATKRISFGRNAVEIKGASPTDSRVGAMLSVREYPAYTGPGSIDNLLSVPHEFIVTQSYGIVDRAEALSTINLIDRQVDMSDEAGTIVAEHLAEARDELLGSAALYGEHHMSVFCLGRSMADLQSCVTAVGGALTDRSMLWTREDLNCEPAFWAMLPGNFGYIARRSLISSKNLAGFMSMHNYASGRPTGGHWGLPISILETSSQTAYFYNHHVRDIGNFTVVGPTGSGKTVFMSFISAQTLRIQPRPKLVYIDKDRGAEIFIRAMGGQYEVLTPGDPTGFNPLMLPDSGSNREFLFQLFSFMLKPPSVHETLSASEQQVIRNAVNTVLAGGPEGRTLPEFATLLRGRLRQNEGDLMSRLASWVAPEQKGWLFNNPADRFSVTSIFGFDMTRVLDLPDIRTAALMYIFHRIEELFTGDPVMIFIDEAWKMLEDPEFAYFIKDKLKTIRKRNGIVGLGTQTAKDIVRSPDANTIIEQSLTNIFFPNAKADDESYGQAFRLSRREVAWIRENVPESRQFLIKSGQDSVIARLDLGSMPDLVRVLSGRTETLAECAALRERHGEDPAAWLPRFLGRAV